MDRGICPSLCAGPDPLHPASGGCCGYPRPPPPAAALPVILGILRGPAASGGLGIGNLARDFSGSWSPMSFTGFFINFLYPYLSCLLWHRRVKGREVRMDRYCLTCSLMVTFVITLACRALLAACGTLFFSRPLESRFISYFGNSIIWVMVTGPVLFRPGLKKAVRNGFVYSSEWGKKETI